MFDGTSYDHWKRKMKMHLSTMHKKVWEVTEKDYVILDEENQSPKIKKMSNATQWLSTPYTMHLIQRCLSKSRASEVWQRLQDTYEGTPAVKSAKLYILKDKLTSFKMQDGESILEMFHKLNVIVTPYVLRPFKNH